MVINRILLSIVLLTAVVAGIAAEESTSAAKSNVSVLGVGGNDLTGLNAGALENAIANAKTSGAQALVIDLSGLSHMTPAGMDALLAGARSMGKEHFAVTDPGGQPGELLRSAGEIRVFSTVDEAAAALR